MSNSPKNSIGWSGENTIRRLNLKPRCPEAVEKETDNWHIEQIPVMERILNQILAAKDMARLKARLLFTPPREPKL